MMTPYDDAPAPRSLKEIEKDLRVAERVLHAASSEAILCDAEAIVRKLKEERDVALLCNA